MRNIRQILFIFAAAAVLAVFLAAGPALCSDQTLPVYLRDRGTGVPTSMFGIYVRKGELIFYPFFEYYRNSDEEYQPSELGYEGEDDYRGEHEAFEGLVFLGYGITDDLAVELEAAVIKVTQKKSPDDPSNMPDEISESGLGDVEGQVRWRFMRENESRPELFSFFEFVFPTQGDRDLIGTPDWEFALGAGVTKGFGWGTVTGRASVAYSVEESAIEPGEYAVEYIKRLSPSWRIYAAIEGSEDEIEGIPEIQWHIRPNVILKLNSAIGLTSKASDWAPEVGVLFYF